MLAYITGTIDQELLLRNEYLAAENRILRAQISSRCSESALTSAAYHDSSIRSAARFAERVAASMPQLRLSA